ncbi:MAG: hypothetical protein QM714_12350 [Nocardioides sp.]|uniref:hypothetical protein n=1 Tax=Nocardioides sp. TaxID=35761 RepID=UPI0039E5BA6A
MSWQTNLDVLRLAEDELSPFQRDQLGDYLLGGLAALVDTDSWAKLVADGVKDVTGLDRGPVSTPRGDARA